MPLTAYLTGATGCIGRNVLDVLLRDKWRVIALVRDTADVSGIPAEVEVRRSGWVYGSQHADAIFHCAGNTSFWRRDREQQLRDNVGLSERMAELAAKIDARFVMTSTAAVFSAVNVPYVTSKRWAEGVAREANPSTIILRPVACLGRYDRAYRPLLEGIARGKLRRALPGSCSFASARAVAEAHVAAYHRGEPGASYFLGGANATWLELFNEVAHQTGRPAITKTYPRWALRLKALWDEAWGVLGYRPQMTRDMLRLLDAEIVYTGDLEADALHALGYLPATAIGDVLREWIG